MKEIHKIIRIRSETTNGKKKKVPSELEDIDLRQQIISKQSPPERSILHTTKQGQMFTEKCLQILSRKRIVTTQEKHRNRMRKMMDNIMERHQKYNKVLSNHINLKLKEDKLFKTLKSTEFHKTNLPKDWKSKPDLQAIQKRKNVTKSSPNQLQGVICFSATFSSNPALKKTLTTHSSLHDKSKAKLNPKENHRVMSITYDEDALYMKRLKAMLDFLFKVNYSNKICTNLQLSDDTLGLFKYKVYVGYGNNSLLIKSLLKRRFWLQVVDSVDESDISFYWSQNKLNRIHQKQKITKFSRTGQSEVFRRYKDEEIYQLNKKILSSDQATKVERYILKDGYIVPAEGMYSSSIITNHIPQNSCIGSKKNLLKSLCNYYSSYLNANPFEHMPKSYCVRNVDDPEFERFVQENEGKKQKIWIMKPAQNTNRGYGISLGSFSKILSQMKKHSRENKMSRSYIIQSYISRPFLYYGRKFDIRHFIMVSCVNGIVKAYWYKEGYLRTSSLRFDLDDIEDRFIHLTNDAIQQKSQRYEKYEAGNKLSYADFQRYLDLHYSGKGYSLESVLAKMRGIVLDAIRANYQSIDRKQANFEIFGFDFMIDYQFKPWLIEINANPCLQISCNLLSRIIPIMVENSLRIGLDPLLPPMSHYPPNKRFTLTDNYLKNLKYELMFDESTLENEYPIFNEVTDSEEEVQEYNDDGKQIEDLLI